MYTVVTEFLDAQNEKRHYKVGDEFDVKGVNKKRIEELAGDSNKIGVPLIVENVPQDDIVAEEPKEVIEEPKEDIVKEEPKEVKPKTKK